MHLNNFNVLFVSAHDLDELDHWIVVFGFEPSQLSLVTEVFEGIGPTVQRRKADNGNWMHIRYRNKADAEHALSKNGQVIGGGALMIGVSRCMDTVSVSVLKIEHVLSSYA